jgi:glycerol-3-phosphate cytidylyltransferase
MCVGYTAGVYDLFHVGHLRLIQAAAALCDRLIVGVSTDEVAAVKGSRPVISETHRMEVLRGIVGVDVVIPQTDFDKVKAHDRLKYDVLFIGDDWYGDDRWAGYEKTLKERGVDIIYLPYTTEISSTSIINEIMG